MATVGVEELHVAEPVTVCVLPSLKVPIAVNCSVEPMFNEPDGALTAIDCSVAEVTVSTNVFDTTPLCDALMLVVPPVSAVAKPVAVIVATAVFEELQATELVRFCVLPSVNVPVAVNWSVVPAASEELAPLTVIVCSVAAVMVSPKAFEVTPFCDAVMFVEPTLFAVAKPLALIVATAVLEELHVTEVVRFCVVPSVKVPVAVN